MVRTKVTPRGPTGAPSAAWRAGRAEKDRALCDAMARERVLAAPDLVLQILRGLLQPKDICAAEQTGAVWRAAATGNASELWRGVCERSRFPLLLSVQTLASRPGRELSFRQLYAQRVAANSRATSGRPSSFVPPVRSSYRIGVEVRVGAGPAAGKCLLASVHEMSPLSASGGRQLVQIDAVARESKDGPLKTSAGSSDLSVCLFLLRKRDQAQLVITKEVDDTNNVDSGKTFATTYMPGTGQERGIFKECCLDIIIDWEYSSEADDTATLQSVTVELEEDVGCGEEPMVSSVEHLLEIIESPAFASRWVPPQTLQTAIQVFPWTQFAAPTSAWGQIESKGSLLSLVLGNLSASDLRRASEVSRRWHAVSVADSVWKARCALEFPALEGMATDASRSKPPVAGPSSSQQLSRPPLALRTVGRGTGRPGSQDNPPALSMGTADTVTRSW